MTLFCIIVAIACILTLPRLALLDLLRSGATKTFVFDLRWMTLATAIGAFAVTLAGVGADLPGHSRLVIVALAALLALGAWIDRISAWAPDAIMLPLSMALFLVSPEISSLMGAGKAIGFGTLLFLGCILLWIVQDAVGYRFAPPADLVAIAAPIILFGMSMTTSAVFLAISILLLAAKKIPGVVAIFSRPEALADGSADVVYNEDAKSVTFLSVSFPVLIIAQMIALATGTGF